MRYINVVGVTCSYRIINLREKIYIYINKMLDGNEMSAFAVQQCVAKRKQTESLLKSKKIKTNLPQVIAMSNQKNIEQKDVNQVTNSSEIKSKCTLNVAIKAKGGVVARTGNLRIMQSSFLSAAKKKKSLEELNNRIQYLDKRIGDVQNMHKDPKLKTKKTLIKKDKIKNSGKNEAVKTQYIKEQDNRLNNSLNCPSKSAEYFGGLNPIASSQHLFEWLIHPLDITNFLKQNWEKTPVHIKRNNPNYYKYLMSTPLLDKILRENHIAFGKNIDVTSYADGKRENHNPPGRAVANVIWDYYLNNCSIRMLNPQTFIPQLHELNATLQEFFGCFVGANSYLTPPNSQGFAPHYDDIEAFILQIEGKKRWRLYMPPNENEYLPRYSSNNFKQSEIGEPILDTVVNAGDLLYLPRGTIHQGVTIDDTHSLHITLSVYQQNSWCDLLEKILPRALKRATETDSRFREGLPFDYVNYTGVVHGSNQSIVRSVFKEKIKRLIVRMIDHIDIDGAADLMAKSHISDFLPPILTKDEKKCSVEENSETMTANGIVKNCTKITLETRIRLLRSHCIRLMKEGDAYIIYYSTENSKEYHEYELPFLGVDKELFAGIRKIITSYPEFVRVKDLPMKNEDDKIPVVRDLWERRLIITDIPLSSED